MKKYLLTLVMLLFSAGAFCGGFIKGNGGNVLFCPALKQTVVLDSYEQTMRFGLHPDKENLSSQKFYELLLKKANKISFSFSNTLKQSLLEVQNNILILENVNLGPIDDSYPFFIPKQCELKLAALQRNGKVLISSNYWLQLAPEQKLFLLVHESLYLQALKINPNIDDSDSVRILNALLLSQELSVWSQSQVLDFLKMYQLVK